MRSLDITKENLDNQRNAVQEERRLGVDNQPYGKTFEAIDELAYDNFAYEHSVIGSMADLNAATVDDVATFFKTYYAPNNAVLRSSATCETAKALAQVREVLRAHSVAAAPPAVDMTEPPQTAERRQTIEDTLARLPRIDIVVQDAAALVARRRRADGAGLGALERPQLALLREHRAAEAALAERERVCDQTARPRSLPASARPRCRARPSRDLEAAIDAEIEKVKTGRSPTGRSRRRGTTGSAAGRRASAARSSARSRSGENALFYDNPNLINTYADRIAQGHRGGRAARGPAVSWSTRHRHGRHHDAEGRRRIEGGR